ncbi:MAG: 50S ribosomal protein L13 [Patescibacteria group bacterium]
MKTLTLDATGKVFGRIASEAARMLRGKDSPDYTPNVEPKVKVEIKNASKAGFTGKKRTDKYYLTYSGYTGGQKRETVEDVITRKGYQDLFSRAVWKMLPDNRMRRTLIKNLIVTD